MARWRSFVDPVRRVTRFDARRREIDDQANITASKAGDKVEGAPIEGALTNNPGDGGKMDRNDRVFTTDEYARLNASKLAVVLGSSSEVAYLKLLKFFEQILEDLEEGEEETFPPENPLGPSAVVTKLDPKRFSVRLEFL